MEGSLLRLKSFIPPLKKLPFEYEQISMFVYATFQKSPLDLGLGTLNEVKQDDSSEAMVRVYQPPVVNNSRGQTSGQQSINGFQVLFFNMFIRQGRHMG